jgi:hypothetical protein
MLEWQNLLFGRNGTTSTFSNNISCLLENNREMKKFCFFETKIAKAKQKAIKRRQQWGERRRKDSEKRDKFRISADHLIWCHRPNKRKIKN